MFVLMGQKIGSALRTARLAANVRQKDLAKFLAISQAFLSDIEKGRRRLPVERYASLPAPIRDAVIDAAKGELRDQISMLDQLAKGSGDAGTGR